MYFKSTKACFKVVVQSACESWGSYSFPCQSLLRTKYYRTASDVVLHCHTLNKTEQLSTLNLLARIV